MQEDDGKNDDKTDEESQQQAADEEKKYSHEFTDEELEKMMYLWDKEASSIIHEYLYMKKAWRDLPPGEEEEEDVSGTTTTEDKGLKNTTSSLQQNAVDSQNRTHVDLSTPRDGDEDPVFLDLDTQDTAHVVEFYAPWCPHCIRMRTEYIELAAEIQRRSIGVPVEFHAVSCELFWMVCRAYGVTGFPVVLGYPIGEDIQGRGVELNPITEPEMTAESIARDLNLVLANEPKKIQERNFTTVEDRLAFETEQASMAQKAFKRKRIWQEYNSTVDERYHNAAVSLVFVLKNGIYMGKDDVLDDIRALALKEFLELIDWTTPQSWHVRSGLVQDLLNNLPSVVSGYRELNAIVDRHLAVDIPNYYFWGGHHHDAVQQKPTTTVTTTTSLPTRQLDGLIRNNTRWTPACTHSQRSLGYTCGLWNLFHIISIGSSLPDHQLYGFLSGYLTAPADVAEILKRFIGHFFGCEVCRRNFLRDFDNCGQDHCERLPTEIAISETTVHGKLRSSLEFSHWLLEVHNDVNRRLMNESAGREGRVVTRDETLASVFPPTTLCPNCWNDDDMMTYDPHKMSLFLHEWFWPRNETYNLQFQEKFTWRAAINEKVAMVKDEQPSTVSDSLLFVAISAIALVVFIATMARRHTHAEGKTL